MRRRTRGGGSYYQYLSNTGYSNGVAMPITNQYLRGSDSALANPTPWARTLTGGCCKRKRRSRTRRRR